MKCKSCLLFFLLLTVCPRFLYARMEGMRHLGVEDGLSNNFVLAMAQDKRGCVWVATDVGLNRFDGSRFTVYKAHDSGLAGDALNTLLYDSREDVLWVGGKFGGLCAYEGRTGRFRTYEGTKDMQLWNVAHLAWAADGGIWVVPHHAAPLYFNPRTKRFTTLAEMGITLDYHSNWCVFEDAGLLYVGHSRGGMSIVDLKRKTVRRLKHEPDSVGSLPGNSVYTIYKDKVGHLWVGTEWGLGLWRPAEGSFVAFRHQPGNPSSLVADHIYAICEMDGGKLWIACDIGGISILDLSQMYFNRPEEVVFENLLPVAAGGRLSSGNIRALLQDSFGNVWIGNYSSGLDFAGHVRPAFQTLGERPVYGLYRDGAGQVWVGSENELWQLQDGRMARRFDLSRHLLRPYGRVNAIVEESPGALLLGISDNGVLRLDTRTGRTVRLDAAPRDMSVNMFFRDQGGKIWLGTVLGLYSYERGMVRQETALNGQLVEKSVCGILRDRQGKLWVGTYGWGIKVFDRKGQAVAELNTGTGFPDNTVISLLEDSRGGVWVATRAGLGHIRDTRHPMAYEFYGYGQGLEDVYVRSVQEDAHGGIWIATNNGVSHWDAEHKRFDNFDFRDGIPSGNFCDRAACLDSSGVFCLGSLSGVCRFSPLDVDTMSRRLAGIQILECREMDSRTGRGGALLLPGENGVVELPHDRNTFRIDFSVPDYSQNRQVEYAYRMGGAEDGWVNVGSENHIVFRSIPPGHYMFQVKAKLRNGLWDEKNVATLQVRVHPPVWHTWYAYVFYGLASVCLFVFGGYAYKRKLAARAARAAEVKRLHDEQELNDERLRFYTNITHELRTPLTLILGPLEDLAGDGSLAEAYRKKIGLVYKSALRLLDQVNRLLDFRKVETQNRRLSVSKGRLGQFVKEVGLRYKELNRNPSVEFHVDVPAEDVRIWFDREVVATILDNLLGNAMKYTSAGHINLRLRTGEEGGSPYAEISVSDTGYGISPQALPRIFDRYYQEVGKRQVSGSGIGLALVKALADLHEAVLSVESEQGKGSVFTLRLWADQTYPQALHSGETAEEAVVSEDGVGGRPLLLVVEDNEDIRDYVASSFSEEFRVVTAADGKEGWEKARQLVPDIVVSDIMMPEMDGTELCRRMKEDVRTCHIPVILLTAKDSIQDKEEGYESGADSYLTKPFSAKLLASRVRNLLEGRRRLARWVADKAKGSERPLSDGLRLGKLDEEFLQRFTDVVTAHICEERLDIPFMAGQMNMSVSTLYRKLKGLTGLSGNELIRKIKLKRGLCLMTEQGFNVTEAAYASGFNDVGHFRRCFKEEYGESPSKFVRH